MVRNCFKYLLGLILGVILLSGCHYAEMIEYNDIPRIVFVGTDKRGNDSYDVSTLHTALNFGLHLKGDSIQCDTIEVKIRLLGDIMENPLKISLNTEPVEKYPEAVMEFLNPYSLKDSAYSATLKVVVNRPAERHKEYKANIVFDFANSDVAMGLDTLQYYAISITDEVTYELLKIEEEDWTNYIQPTIGVYSENKARFMIMTLKMTDFGTLTYSWVLRRNAVLLRKALDHYNQVNSDNKLKDENGNFISFDPE
ncbi:MAG: hypothetical protein RSC80_07955 [Odoribacter sp.]